jgi:hypothetical protein
MNKLPPLPEAENFQMIVGGPAFAVYTAEQMQAFAQLAADHALEEAARAADDQWVRDPQVSAGDAIRAMKGKP